MITRLIMSTSFLLSASVARAEVNLSLFGSDALVQAPDKVDCTLTTGEAATCVRLVVKYKPDHLAHRPVLSRNVDDEGGIWSWDGDKPGPFIA